MSEKMSKTFKIASVYIGVILGAGFASGSEILKFFIQYGYLGFCGLAFSAVLFWLIGWAVLDLSITNKIKSGYELLIYVMGNSLGKIVQILSVTFMFILFCAMLAAGGAISKEVFNIGQTSGIIIIAALVFITLMFDLKGIITINVILSPIMIIGGIIIGLYSFITQDVRTFSTVFTNFNVYNNWLVSAITYVCYNVITAISVLTSFSDSISSKKIAFWGSALGGIAIGILALSLSIPLFLNFNNVYNLQLPMFGIVKKYSNIIKYIYVAVLLIAVYTTAVANCFGILKWISFKATSLIKTFSITFIGVLLAHIGFSNFIDKVYPLFGVLGLFEVIIILLHFFIENICRKRQ